MDHLVLWDFNFSLEGRQLIQFDELEFFSGMHLLWGVSGSGKTTFLEYLAGRREGRCGRVEFKGRNFELHNPASSQRFFEQHLSIQYQDPTLLEELSVLENIQLPWRLMGRLPKENEVDQTLFEKLQLTLLQNKPITKLSRGEKQRVGLARALYGSCDILLLDEPLVYLQKDLGENIFQYICERVLENNLICFVSSHDPYIRDSDVFSSRLKFEEGFFGKDLQLESL